MPLAGEVFSQKNVARSECLYGAVSNANLHRAGEINTVLTPGRGMPIEKMAGRVVLENERGCGMHFREES